MVGAIGGVGLGGNVIGQAVIEIVTDSTKADAQLTAMQRRIALGTTVAFGAGVLAATRYETTLAKIQNFTNATTADTERMKASILGLSPAVGRGPQELAEALYFITSAGQYGANALDILDASARASVAGLGTTADIAKVVTSAVNAYGAANLTAAKATDVLIAAVREGSAEPQEFADQLGRVIGVAAQLGVQFADVAAAVAILTSKGISTDVAVTGLRTTLLALNNPAVQAQAALQGVNLNAEAIRRTIREQGLIQGLQALSAAFGGDAEKIAEVIPEARALVAVFGLVGAEAGKATEAQQRVRDATGLVDETFKRAAATTEVQFRRAIASIMAVLVMLGSEVLPPIADGLEVIADAVGVVGGAFGSLPGPVRQSLIVLGLLAALMPVIEAGLLRLRTAYAVTTPMILANARAVTAARQAEAAAIAGGNAALATSGLGMGSGAVAAASFAAFERGEIASRRTAAALGILRTAGIGAGVVLGSMAAQSDNATISFLGMTAQGAALGAMFGPWGAVIGGAIGLMMGLANATDSATAAMERQRSEMMRRAQDIAGSMTPQQIRAQLEASRNEVERLRTETAAAERRGRAGGGRNPAALRSDLFDAEQRAITFANALNIVTRGEELNAEQAKKVADATRLMTRETEGANRAVGSLGPTMLAESLLADALATKVLTVADAMAVLQVVTGAAKRSMIDSLASVADQADDTALAAAAALDAIAHGPSEFARMLREMAAGEGFRKLLEDLGDPTGALRAAAGLGGSSRSQSAEDIIRERIARAVAEALSSGDSVEGAVDKIRSQAQRMAEMLPAFEAELARHGIVVTDEFRKMFLTMEETAKQETLDIGNLLGFLIQRRVGMGLPGATRGGQPVWGDDKRNGFLTQHNEITLMVPDPSNVDVAGIALAQRRAGFGAQS